MSNTVNSKYYIENAEVFNIGNYPKVEPELSMIKKLSSLFISADKADIIISLLKDHNINESLQTKIHNL